jgi:hypothetical protein
MSRWTTIFGGNPPDVAVDVRVTETTLPPEIKALAPLTPEEQKAVEEQKQAYVTLARAQQGVSNMGTLGLPLPEDTIVGVLTGYRAWRVPMFENVLTSMSMSTKWLPCKRMEAVCAGDVCGGIECSCGVYAYKDAPTFRNANDDWLLARHRLLTIIWGEVYLWGRVLECEQGYRAQYAYPKNFMDTGTFAKQMAAIYRVPLVKP